MSTIAIARALVGIGERIHAKGTRSEGEIQAMRGEILDMCAEDEMTGVLCDIALGMLQGLACVEGGGAL